MAFRLFPGYSRPFRPRPSSSAAAASSQPRKAASGFLLSALLWLSALAFLHRGEGQRYSNLALGQKAPVTVIAAVDFTCEDTARTALNRQQVAETILPVFSINYAAYNATVRTLDKLFGRIVHFNESSTNASAAAQSSIEEVVDLLGLSITAPEALALVLPGEEDKTLAALKESLRSVWSAGIATADEKSTLFHGVATKGLIALGSADGTSRNSAQIEDLLTPDDALAKVLSMLRLQLGGVPFPETAFRKLLSPWIKPNLAFDARQTNELRAQAEKGAGKAVMNVRAGDTLMEARERITPTILEVLRAHEKRMTELESPRDRALRLIGTAGLTLAFLLICIGLLQVFEPADLQCFSTELLMIILSLASLLMAKGSLYLSQTLQWPPPWMIDYILPISLAPILASILIGATAAIVLGVWNSLLFALLMNNSFTVLTHGIVVTVVVVLFTRDVRRRSQIIRAGLSIGLASMLLAISFAAFDEQTFPVMLFQAMAGMLTCIVAAIVASLLIPPFEMAFGITTDISLLELSDMSHPLLQRLAMEAPGTYHHSLMLANLAQAAATAIDANALLARVCAYYHDIGKLIKPEFFAENTHLRENPHDDLSPSMSTLVIQSHIKEGVGLVQRYKLPRAVIAGIEQHHGTSMVSYFYQRARQQQEEESKGPGGTVHRGVNEQDFRYPGPKPQSREVAILALADGVEAASRSLEKPNASRLENLVNEVVQSKLLDGQLDESNLTMADLTRIKKAFVFTLTNMLHGRISYAQNENKTAQPAKKTSDTQPGNPASRSVAPGSGGSSANA